jgi:hypothetical protein
VRLILAALAAAVAAAAACPAAGATIGALAPAPCAEASCVPVPDAGDDGPFRFRPEGATEGEAALLLAGLVVREGPQRVLGGLRELCVIIARPGRQGGVAVIFPGERGRDRHFDLPRGLPALALRAAR